MMRIAWRIIARFHQRRAVRLRRRAAGSLRIAEKYFQKVKGGDNGEFDYPRGW